MAKTKISTVVTTETTTTEIQEFIPVTSAVTPCAYKFGDQSIRVFTIDGEPWFVAVDICKALGITDAHVAIRKLDEDERMQVIDSNTQYLIPDSKINNLLNVVSESGMNALVLRCRDAMTQGTPAHKFRKWVTSEVLPSLRKTGSYHTQPTAAKPVPRYITGTQLREISDQVEWLVRPSWKKSSYTYAIWNRIRFITNAENKSKIPADQYDTVMNELKRMEQIVYSSQDRSNPSIVEAIAEMQDWLYIDYLCGNTPFTSTQAKVWKEKYQTLLPEPLNWRNIALQLETSPC